MHRRRAVRRGPGVRRPTGAPRPPGCRSRRSPLRWYSSTSAPTSSPVSSAAHRSGAAGASTSTGPTSGRPLSSGHSTPPGSIMVPPARPTEGPVSQLNRRPSRSSWRPLAFEGRRVPDEPDPLGLRTIPTDRSPSPRRATWIVLLVVLVTGSACSRSPGAPDVAAEGQTLGSGRVRAPAPSARHRRPGGGDEAAPRRWSRPTGPSRKCPGPYDGPGRGGSGPAPGVDDPVGADSWEIRLARWVGGPDPRPDDDAAALDGLGRVVSLQADSPWPAANSARARSTDPRSRGLRAWGTAGGAQAALPDRRRHPEFIGVVASQQTCPTSCHRGSPPTSPPTSGSASLTATRSWRSATHRPPGVSTDVRLRAGSCRCKSKCPSGQPRPRWFLLWIMAVIIGRSRGGRAAQRPLRPGAPAHQHDDQPYGGPRPTAGPRRDRRQSRT